MTIFRFLRKGIFRIPGFGITEATPKVRILVFALAVTPLMVLVSGCASSPSDSGSDPTYSEDLFYIGQAPSPAGPHKVHLDFFDKECTSPGGHQAGQSSDFSCHYSDQ